MHACVCTCVRAHAFLFNDLHDRTVRNTGYQEHYGIIMLSSLGDMPTVYV